MSQYSPYMLNVAPNGDSNQYNMQSFEVNSMLKNLFENNGNALANNMNVQDNAYFQQNKVPNQYYIQIPPNYTQIQQQYMPVMPLSNGNMFYINQPSQFPVNDSTGQFNAQLVPVQVPTGIMPVANNNLNKSTDQTSCTNSRSRKKTYKTANKAESGSADVRDDIPRDTRNRPLSFSCSECSKRFSTQSRLDQHFLCHTNERPYVCPECLFAFTQKSYLMRHAAVHKEERSFECELCKKTYKHYGSLANHRKTHKNGAKSSAKTSMEKEQHDVSNKMEEPVNTNSSVSYVPVTSGGEYLYQGHQEMHHVNDQNQSYNSQYTSDMSMYANAFQNQMSSNMSSEINSSFLDQLNFHNPTTTFYPLMTANNSIAANTDVAIELRQHESASDLNNNSLISLDCPPQSLNQSSAATAAVSTATILQDHTIPTYTV